MPQGSSICLLSDANSRQFLSRHKYYIERRKIATKKEEIKPKFWRCGDITRQQEEMRKIVNDS